MSKAQLRLVYIADDDYHGVVVATVNSGAFFGEGKAWFVRAHLKETFIAALRAFPLLSHEPPIMESGFASREGPHKLVQCHLRIAIVPGDACGTPMVCVDLATPVWKPDDDARRQRLESRFLTEYAAIDRFADDFEHMLDGDRPDAVLFGTPIED